MKTYLLNINHLNDPVTIFLMVSFLLIYIVSLKFKTLRFRFFLHPVSITKQKEVFRLITADVIHHDLPHLILNELLLYFYGASLENFLNGASRYGSFEFIAIYLFSCLAGATATTILHRNEVGFSSAGASGSLMGCMFSYILLDPKRIAFFLPVVGPVDNLYFGLISILLLIIYQRKTKNELINHEQHFFGALGGIIITLILFPGLLK
jgi:membrane associated rhomboid family serine protease